MCEVFKLVCFLRDIHIFGAELKFLQFFSGKNESSCQSHSL